MELVVGSIYALFGLLARRAYLKGGAEAYWFLGNIGLTTLVAALLFGPVALVVAALMALPVIFFLLISLTRGG